MITEKKEQLQKELKQKDEDMQQEKGQSTYQLFRTM